MNAWFGPDVAVWFSFLSLLSLVAALEPLARRGTHRPLVLGVLAGAVVLGIGFLAAGAAAVALDQPWHVVFPLLWTGAVATPALMFGRRSALRAYSAAEARRIVARNL